jgi:hypothetical protein
VHGNVECAVRHIIADLFWGMAAADIRNPATKRDGSLPMSDSLGALHDIAFG